MNDHQKKSFVNTFIDSIELYPNKGRKKGCVIKSVHFKFPVSYERKEVYEVLSSLESTDDTDCYFYKGKGPNLCIFVSTKMLTIG